MTFSSPSLLRRIIVRLAATTLAAIICAYGWLWIEFQTTTGSLREKSLIETARMIAAALKVEGAAIVLDVPPVFLDAFAQSAGAHGFAVTDRSDGMVLFSAGAGVGPPPGRVVEDEDGTLYQYNPDGPGPAAFFGEAFPVKLDKRDLLVQVVRSGSDYQDLIETVLVDFFEDGGWLAGPFLLALLGVSILTVQGTLRPLRALSRQAQSIGPHSTHLRLPEQSVPREVMPLVKTFNAALDRLQAGFQRQRDFTADAAHELRTPLAVLSAHIDTLEDRKTAKELRRDLDGMTHLVEQLLRISRVEDLVVAPGDQTDLAALARSVAEYLAPMAIRAGRLIEVDAPESGVFVHGQSDALFHALRNLVDNALRHTIVGSAVEITVGDHPPRAVVRDHGPGIPAAQRQVMFERFWRAERHTVGSGLGLAIVRRTMEAHGGTVEVDDSPGGGALFKLIFPSM